MKRVFYELYYWLIFIPIFLVLTILTAIVVVVGCFLGGERFFAYYPGMMWSWFTCYLALCPVKISGLEHIKKGQSYVFVANHQGAFDIFVIYGFLGSPIKWVMKKEIEKIPFVGRACKAAGFVFVDSSSAKAAAQTIQEAERRLKRGTSIIIFPEGSRTYTGEMIQFKKGAFQIAADLKLPIIPITLNGPFDVLPIGSIRVKPHRMEMIVHPAIETSEQSKSPQYMKALANNTQQTIASALWDRYTSKKDLG
jgi:1-acyl-sn-glycerol-3-phosphate acyltransferase